MRALALLLLVGCAARSEYVRRHEQPRPITDQEARAAADRRAIADAEYGRRRHAAPPPERAPQPAPSRAGAAAAVGLMGIGAALQNSARAPRAVPPPAAPPPTYRCKPSALGGTVCTPQP